MYFPWIENIWCLELCKIWLEFGFRHGSVTLELRVKTFFGLNGKYFSSLLGCLSNNNKQTPSSSPRWWSTGSFKQAHFMWIGLFLSMWFWLAEKWSSTSLKIRDDRIDTPMLFWITLTWSGKITAYLVVQSWTRTYQYHACLWVQA